MASTIKIKRSSIAGKKPTTSNISTGELALNIKDGRLFSANSTHVFEIGANVHSLSVGSGSFSIANGAMSFPSSDGTNGQALITDGSGNISFGDISADFTSVGSNIVPSANNTYDLGTAGLRWRDLFLSGQTINLGGATISSDGTGTIQISGAGATLPPNSKVQTQANNVVKTIATVGDGGTAEIEVNLFTQSSGLSTAANTFFFKVNTERKVFTNFTLNNGETITDTGTTLFLF